MSAATRKASRLAAQKANESAPIGLERGRAAAWAMTAEAYDYAGPLLSAWFATLCESDVRKVLRHVGRYKEKGHFDIELKECPEWPRWEETP